MAEHHGYPAQAGDVTGCVGSLHTQGMNTVTGAYGSVITNLSVASMLRFLPSSAFDVEQRTRHQECASLFIATNLMGLCSTRPFTPFTVALVQTF